MKIMILAALIAPGALAAAGPYLAGGETCPEMQPICFSGDYKFKFDEEKRSTSIAWRLDRPEDFGCLGSSPGEQWFFFETDEAGNAKFDMKSYRDHDYAIWGPYSSLAEAKSSCGNTGEPKDCSYSGDAHEYAEVENVQKGSFYTLLVTNYALITQELEINSQGVSMTCDAVETKYQTEKTKWEAAGAPQEVMAGTTANPTANPTASPTVKTTMKKIGGNDQKPSCTYVDHSSGYRGRGCGDWTAFCESRELVELAKELVFKCQHTCKFSKYLEDVCVTSSVPTVSPTAFPTKFPTVPPTDAPSRRPHVESGRSNEHHPDDHTGEHIETHTDEYLEANFDCYYKNCQEWDCAMWCKCFEQETEDADLYAESGCEDDGDNSCECVENVLGLHESEENWNFFGDSQAKPDQIKHHYNNIVVGTGVENYAETVKTFKRPFILDVWMKQDLDQNMDHYQDYPGAGNVFVFPQNKGGECSGYCMGINHQLASQTIEDLDFEDWTNNDYFYFAGGGKSKYQERKFKLNGNQTSINEHELWQKLTMKFTLDGHVSYYFNAEKNPRLEDLDTTYMEGSIRLGMNAANYRYHSPQITKGARDASVNIAPWRRLGSDYEEYWGEQYRTQWD